MASTKQDLIPDLIVKNIIPYVQDSYRINPAMNLYFEGTPGIGKTEAVLQAGEKMKREYPEFFTSVIILSQMESSDFSIPWVYTTKDGKVTYEKVALVDFIMDPKSRGIIFADEAPNASHDVQKAFMNICSSRQIGKVRIPDGVQIIGAGNRKEDRAGANGLLTSFANRFIHAAVIAEADGWLYWAERNGIDYRVRFYIREHNASLNDFVPTRPINPTPRMWERVSDVVKQDSRFLFNHVAGAVGQDKAVHFTQFIKLFNELPTKDEIIRNPSGCKLPSKPDYQVALAFAMIDWVDEKNKDNIITYLNRMGEEHQALFFKACKETKIEILERNKKFVEWARLHQDLIVGG